MAGTDKKRRPPQRGTAQPGDSRPPRGKQRPKPDARTGEPRQEGSRERRPRQARGASASFELTLDSMAHGGSALGLHHGRAVLVPYTIPGETITARQVGERGGIVRAEGVQLLDASADRVYPRCPHFGPHRCGRCQWQHIDYAAQLLIKQDVLADQLARIAMLDDAPVLATIPSPDVWGYNYHMTFVTMPDGRLGFPGTDPKTIEPIRECHILHPDLLALYHQLDFDPTGLALRSLRLQIDSDGETMLILALDDENAPELETDAVTSVNLLLPTNEPVNLIGDLHARYTVGSQTFRVTVGSAFRANVSQLPTLAARVLALLAPQTGEHILDLYAGVGFFSAFLAAGGVQVTAVESYPPAAVDAEINLAPFPHARVIEASVDDALAALDGTFSAAVVDPPSDGLSEAGIARLSLLGVTRLVYVSGDPVAFARACARLNAAGWTLDAAQPIDMSPQTYFIDTVAAFTRR